MRPILFIVCGCTIDYPVSKFNNRRFVTCFRARYTTPLTLFLGPRSGKVFPENILFYLIFSFVFSRILFCLSLHSVLPTLLSDSVKCPSVLRESELPIPFPLKNLLHRQFYPS